ncbi:hypothetical protein G6F64_015260 [Rhizopus arrhizus]|uniref:Uncharacterized protein n=1 Tax=Rhizopus oryzae TaxID=64495 RepID=A0A9P7BIJ3_RHIOR|nr:hypothetical protein G6F64_015260 [Rhizopus arrhizus]
MAGILRICQRHGLHAAACAALAVFVGHGVHYRPAKVGALLVAGRQRRICRNPFDCTVVQGVLSVPSSDTRKATQDGRPPTGIGFGQQVPARG